MRFTLIVATLDRTDELIRLFESLLNQSYRDFDVILVDQNPDNQVFDIYHRYKEYFYIKYIHTSEKGLSHARNLGLKCKLNEIVAFPDDDCWYAPDTLERVHHIFKSEVCDILSGQPIDKDGKLLVHNYLKNDCMVTLQTIWNAAISFTVFLKRDVVLQVGDFDERLGVGSNTIYGSGEETDYLIRALKLKYNVKYIADLQIVHPRKISVGGAEELRRALSYGAGMGYVLKKHNFFMWFKIRSLIRPLGGALISLVSGNLHMFKVRINTFRGRFIGLQAKI